ncbi:hypothetical protein CEB3_c28780 [Peptococcaceae bacterium CEB3]|nr:hypothetical protein CEB3_c28780 [Peptococcaceae bacterium CEB3]
MEEDNRTGLKRLAIVSLHGIPAHDRVPHDDMLDSGPVDRLADGGAVIAVGWAEEGGCRSQGRKIGFGRMDLVFNRLKGELGQVRVGEGVVFNTASGG